MRISYFKIVAKYIVESDLQRRDACALDFTLLQVEEIVLAVARYLAELVQFFIYPACDDIALSELRSRLRMHCLAQIVKQLSAVTHLRKHLVESRNTSALAKCHYRSGLTKAPAKLHDLARHNLACRRA